MNQRVQVYYEIVNLTARSSCLFGAILLCLLAVPRRDCKMVLINCGPFRSNHIRNNGGPRNSGIFTIEKALQVGCKRIFEGGFQSDRVGSAQKMEEKTPKITFFGIFLHQNNDKIT